jgi:hypothetical protein
MSASEWKACPRCAERAEKAFEEAKENPEIEYEYVKMLEELKEAYRKGYPRDISELDADVRLTTIDEKIAPKVSVDNLYPSDGKLRPVRVDSNITLDGGKLNLTYKAECWNCQYLWGVDKVFPGKQQ